MDPFQLKKHWVDKITFWGCLGSQSTIQFGTPDEIRAQVDKLCSEMGKGGGYILAPSKAIQPGTPVENSAALVEAFSKQNL
jgi:uroporphyrinogen decarboxylase